MTKLHLSITERQAFKEYAVILFSGFMDLSKGKTVEDVRKEILDYNRGQGRTVKVDIVIVKE